MPLTEKGEKILGSMEKTYGPEKAKEVLYASKNAGKISGIDQAPGGGALIPNAGAPPPSPPAKKTTSTPSLPARWPGRVL